MSIPMHGSRRRTTSTTLMPAAIPEHLEKTDTLTQVKKVVVSGLYDFMADGRALGARVPVNCESCCRCAAETLTTAWEQANPLANLIDDEANAWHSESAPNFPTLDAKDV